MVCCGYGVWVALDRRAQIKLYHTVTHDLITDIDVTQPVAKMLASECKGKIPLSVIRIRYFSIGGFPIVLFIVPCIFGFSVCDCHIIIECFLLSCCYYCILFLPTLIFTS